MRPVVLWFLAVVTALPSKITPHTAPVGTGTRPSVPGVGIAFDSNQRLPLKPGKSLQSPELTKAPAEAAKPVPSEAFAVLHKQIADSLSGALHDHHQRLMKSFVNNHMAQQDVGNLVQTDASRLTEDATTMSKQPLPELIKSDSVAGEAESASTGTLDEISTSAAPAGNTEGSRQQLSDHDIDQLSPEEMKKALKLLARGTSSQSPTGQKQHKRHLAPHAQAKGTYRLSLPKSAMGSHVQAKEVYRNILAGSEESASDTLKRLRSTVPYDPNCIPVEICSGGDGTPYFDGEIRDADSAVPFARGMCYKWCPIGCKCC